MGEIRSVSWQGKLFGTIYLLKNVAATLSRPNGHPKSSAVGKGTPSQVQSSSNTLHKNTSHLQSVKLQPASYFKWYDRPQEGQQRFCSETEDFFVPAGATRAAYLQVMEDTIDGKKYIILDSRNLDLPQSTNGLPIRVHNTHPAYPHGRQFLDILKKSLHHKNESFTNLKRDVRRPNHPHKRMKEDNLMDVSCVTICSSSNAYCDDVESGVVNNKGNAKTPVSYSSDTAQGAQPKVDNLLVVNSKRKPKKPTWMQDYYV